MKTLLLPCLVFALMIVSCEKDTPTSDPPTEPKTPDCLAQEQDECCTCFEDEDFLPLSLDEISAGKGSVLLRDDFDSIGNWKLDDTTAIAAGRLSIRTLNVADLVRASLNIEDLGLTYESKFYLEVGLSNFEWSLKNPDNTMGTACDLLCQSGITIVIDRTMIGNMPECLTYVPHSKQGKLLVVIDVKKQRLAAYLDNTKVNEQFIFSGINLDDQIIIDAMKIKYLNDPSGRDIHCETTIDYIEVGFFD